MLKFIYSKIILEKQNLSQKPSKVKTIKQLIVIITSGGLIATNTIFLKELKTLSNYHKPEKLEIVKLAENKVAQQEYKTADELLDLVKGDKNYNQVKVAKLSQKIGKTRNSFSYKAESFWEGFTGKSNGETVSTVGEFTADFTTIGDVKDLYKQYKLYNRGKNIDTFIVGLSVLGIVTSASTIASLGGTAPAKIGVSIIKKAAKLGKIPKWLKIKLSFLGEKIFKSEIDSYSDLLKQIKNQDLSYFKTVFEKIQLIYKQTGDYKTTLELVSKTKNAKDLNMLIKLSKRFAKKTSIFLELGGDDFLKVYKKYGDKIDVKTYEKAIKTKGGLKSLEKLGEKRFLKSFHKPHTRILKEIEKVFGKITDYLKAQIIALLTLVSESLVFLYNLIALLFRRKK